LRDSELKFDPLKYALNQSSPIPERIKSGLLTYQSYNEFFPKRNGLGILFNSGKSPEDEFWIEVPITQNWFIFSAYSIIIISFAGGILLLIFPRKN
jgi:hypothetical protein